MHGLKKYERLLKKWFITICCLLINKIKEQIREIQMLVKNILKEDHQTPRIEGDQLPLNGRH